MVLCMGCVCVGGCECGCGVCVCVGVGCGVWGVGGWVCVGVVVVGRWGLNGVVYGD